ncbi:MAG: peptidase C14 caspase catalytic subunit p20, partial [Nostoc sp.]
MLLSENYKVDLPFFEAQSSVRIPPNEQIASKQIGLFIPPDYLEQGITEYKDILKLIVNTTDFDASLLEQEGLAPATRTRSAIIPKGLLNRLMDQVYTRNGVPFSNESNDHWTTQAITITIVRPQDAKLIQSNQDVVLQEGIAKILPHPSLEAKACLTTVPQVRSLSSSVLPAILQSDASIIQPFQFTTSRGSDPGLSVLQLSEVANPEAVTPESPLKILVNTSLREGEHLLPFAYDGEFFLPLGRGINTPNHQTEITLERLPRPTVDRRSLQGAIRILFQKVLSQKLGKP